ncbi:MAG: L-2,4-diaminobutyrate decarboxylase [Planctomycetota bacterium]|jgi:glutamate/tyrosine decarboxylase-like PLP-dependent enzyme
MDRQTYKQVVDTFFEWNQEELTKIFSELLSAVAAEKSLTPAQIMSQNYETARDNPEIHSRPGNLKDARDSIFPYFWGTDSWNNPLHLENVRGPANQASLIGAIACLLKNPNLCTDRYSQRSNELEVKAITALANLIYYHTDDPWGVFTIGGTISNLYGAKIGLERVVPGAMQKGLAGERVVGICSQASHYSNQTIAGWLGIGTENSIEIPTDENLSMRIDLLDSTLDQLYKQRIKVAYVCATFGTTDGFGIDDVQAIRECVERQCAKHNMPKPQIHCDAAVGWAMSMLTDYDRLDNPLEFSPGLLERIEKIQLANVGLRYADSVTIDFHKMGRSHYPSSAFIVNHREDLKYLARSVSDTPYFSDADPRRDPALFTLECSRPGIGPYAVVASLNGIGLVGWQMLLARGVEMAELLKERLSKLEYCKVLNRGTLGASVNWWVLPKGRNAEEIFQRIVRNELTDEQLDRYRKEIRHLFDKRLKTMNPELDARLGFTTSYGFCPHGNELPGWKAVFFNPKTTDAMVERIVASIEEL